MAYQCEPSIYVSLPEEAKGRPGLQAMAGDSGVPAGHHGGALVAVGQQGGVRTYWHVHTGQEGSGLILPVFVTHTHSVSLELPPFIRRHWSDIAPTRKRIIHRETRGWLYERFCSKLKARGMVGSAGE